MTSRALSKGPCPVCPSSDAFVSYDDGHGHCFSCGHHTGNDGQTVTASPERSTDFARGRCLDIPARGLRKKTCEKWGYEWDGEQHIANYLDAAGNVVGQKLRGPEKRFSVRGKLGGLYGEWLWSGGGKILVVCEGEIDALTVSQLNDLRFPVVSVPNGAQGAAKAIKESLTFVESFERVVFMFDSDEPGRKAAEQCARLLTPGKARIAHLPLKDPNEMLLAGRGAEIRHLTFTAKEWRPDGIMTWEEVEDSIRAYDIQPIAKFPFHKLQERTLGIRRGEIIMIAAAVSAGKSTLCREILSHVVDQGLKVGVLSLEEPVAKYITGLAGLKTGRNFGRSEQLPKNDDEFWVAVRSFKDNVVFYHDGGVRDEQTIFECIRYMAVALGCDLIVLDHLTVIIDAASVRDKVSYADKLMSDLEALVKRTQVSILSAIHLRKGHGEVSHEGGSEITLSDIRGSGQIGALSHTVIAAERNQQAARSNVANLRILKCRHTGRTGPAGAVEWDNETGRLRDSITRNLTPEAATKNTDPFA